MLVRRLLRRLVRARRLRVRRLFRRRLPGTEDEPERLKDSLADVVRAWFEVGMAGPDVF